MYIHVTLLDCFACTLLYIVCSKKVLHVYVVYKGGSFTCRTVVVFYIKSIIDVNENIN